MDTSSKNTFLGLDVEDRWTPLKLFSAIVIVWGVCWFLAYFFLSDWSKRGQFGDMFGAVNALFSGLAFAGIILTILLQREELKAQREELRLNTGALNAQKEEMNAQWKELEKQNVNIKRQRFENTFFSMWDIHFKNRDLMSLNGHNGIIAFAEFIKYSIKYSMTEATQNEINLSAIVRGVDLANEKSGFFLLAEPYLNGLRLIHSAIVEAELQYAAKERYFEIMKAYLTTNEIEFLIYYVNSVKKRGEEKDLMSFYQDLRLGEGFAYKFSKRWDLELIFDEGIL